MSFIRISLMHDFAMRHRPRRILLFYLILNSVKLKMLFIDIKEKEIRVKVYHSFTITTLYSNRYFEQHASMYDRSPYSFFSPPKQQHL